MLLNKCQVIAVSFLKIIDKSVKILLLMSQNSDSNNFFLLLTVLVRKKTNVLCCKMKKIGSLFLFVAF